MNLFKFHTRSKKSPSKIATKLIFWRCCIFCAMFKTKPLQRESNLRRNTRSGPHHQSICNSQMHDRKCLSLSCSHPCSCDILASVFWGSGGAYKTYLKHDKGFSNSPHGCVADAGIGYLSTLVSSSKLIWLHRDRLHALCEHNS